jgi:hypothetical protein
LIGASGGIASPGEVNDLTGVIVTSEAKLYAEASAHKTLVGAGKATADTIAEQLKNQIPRA